MRDAIEVKYKHWGVEDKYKHELNAMRVMLKNLDTRTENLENLVRDHAEKWVQQGGMYKSGVAAPSTALPRLGPGGSNRLPGTRSTGHYTYCPYYT